MDYIFVAILISITFLIGFAFNLITKFKKNGVPTNSALATVGPKKYLSVKLIEKDKLTHDTFKFKFELPKPNMVLGLKTG